MADKQMHNFFLYDFLTGSRYRAWRHAMLVFAMFTIAINQAYSMYIDSYPQLDNKLLLSTIVIAVMTSYLVAIYYNLYVLIPKFLFTRKYFRYLSGVVLSTALLVILLDVIEYGTYAIMGLSMDKSLILDSLGSLFIDFIFTFSLLIICVTGGSLTLLLKQWGIENKNISQLKNNYLQSEIEQLKERISPDFLFSTLNKAGSISISNPEEASSILVRLSQILRYQLYDCTRKITLLDSEIAFIQNYLNLYRTYNSDFEYKIIVEGDSKHIFVAPLLFLPLVQLMIEKKDREIILNLKFIITDQFTGFICSVADDICYKVFDTSGLQNIHRRLRYLYNDSYNLMVNSKQIVLQLNEL